MRNKTLFLALIFSVGNIIAANPLDVREIKLSNGFTVWLNEDHSQPKIVGSVVVKAGAKDSPNTGIAHYFEHIMFKGTDKIGTIDYASEKVFLDSIVAQYNQLATTTDASKRLKIQKKINLLSIEAAKYSIPNEFDRLISKYGGTGLNAGTSFDYTMYYNTFSPQFFSQWCEINSERLINPVFRGFQSELETVYEEKNMYADKLGALAVEKILERIFKPHPYQYPIIGSSENLKNPRLTDMQLFFEKYYVAGNMGLMLSGDFNTSEVLSILEKTFGKIRPGNVQKEKFPQSATFNGVENFITKIPIPLVKANALIWRGIPANHQDELPLQIAMKIFSNNNKTGILDRLTTEGKFMAAFGFTMSLNDAGFIALASVPNIPFQSLKSTQKLLFNAVDSVKSGNFSDEVFQRLKLEEKRNKLHVLEKIDSRVQQMMSLFSEGKSWESFIDEINIIDALSKQDIVDVTNKYLTTNYLYVKKKTGDYPKEKVQKPDFAPILPHNKDKLSDYARWLETIETPATLPRFIDFENDSQKYMLNSNGLARLYHTPNLMNEVFSLSVNFGIGSYEMKEETLVPSYLEYLGTDSMTATQFNERMQQLGSQVYFGCDDVTFNIHVTGFDNKFEETVMLLSDFCKNIKPNKAKLKQVISAYKVEDKALRSSSEDLADAMLEKVKFGNKSSFLNRLTVSEAKEISGENLLDRFKTILSTECDIHYCGTLTSENVVEVIKNNIDVENITRKSNNPIFRDAFAYNEAEVFFLDDPKSTQSIIYGYVLGPQNKNLRSRTMNQLFNSYFGGGMSSLMFQEIREFRSLAYRAQSNMENPPLQMKDKHTRFNMSLSTQADKTIDALNALDSIFHSMPIVDERLKDAKQDILNAAYNNYPSFRAISPRIAYYKLIGYEDDPNKHNVEIVSQLTENDLKDYYNKNFKDAKIIYVIVGNKKQINISELSKFGKVTILKIKDILK